ncbi:DUF572 domain-containing protein [Chloropicon primus]|uniref:Splicing factor YJU2 n=1 Tax=Chloropicon primus TaxID=1764295 RepID=A0A5B8MDB7_9CHLO|nr:DUF572 domain-containing protein [Chloropicon primus]UPQ96831.1 DUF572 domain-containing protein [Chloropicon primus]|mmetsp:Transcript_10403/g.29472  ORF Transcript_10403/g.29472 Transcript_10403/m.29472 type:complete len:281 (-) Transcript_10403:2134-2976(-)|eukprot:QDZ17615.1 DUF572 domain-containing protein [Chloropicon primus]
MGERKVLNKYYPPDFDPSKIQRVKRKKDDSRQIKVRMMLPFSLRCGTCGNYIYKGTKFNSRKEDVEGETYLGLRIYRFYFRCTRCGGEITMKTDPKNSNYICEQGASRNFDPHLEKERQENSVKKKREEEEEGDAMKALENRALDSKREMEELNALDEIKSANNRYSNISTDQVIAALRRSSGEEGEVAQQQEDEDEEVRQLRVLRAKNVKRLDDSAEEATPAAPAAEPRTKKRSLGVSFAVKTKTTPKFVKKAKTETEEAQNTGLAALMDYGSSDDDSG